MFTLCWIHVSSFVSDSDSYSSGSGHRARLTTASRRREHDKRRSAESESDRKQDEARKIMAPKNFPKTTRTNIYSRMFYSLLLPSLPSRSNPSSALFCIGGDRTKKRARRREKMPKRRREWETKSARGEQKKRREKPTNMFSKSEKLFSRSDTFSLVWISLQAIYISITIEHLLWSMFMFADTHFARWLPHDSIEFRREARQQRLNIVFE